MATTTTLYTESHLQRLAKALQRDLSREHLERPGSRCKVMTYLARQICVHDQGASLVVAAICGTCSQIITRQEAL
jgi:hypothetical protein